MTFGGESFEPARDGARLSSQLQAVFDIMKDGVWHTPPEIQERGVVGGTAAITARIRDFRKEKFGAHTVEREYVERGLFRYRMSGGKPL